MRAKQNKICECVDSVVVFCIEDSLEKMRKELEILNKQVLVFDSPMKLVDEIELCPIKGEVPMLG